MKVPIVSSFCDECFREEQRQVLVPQEQADTDVSVNGLSGKVDLCQHHDEVLLGPLRRLLTALGPLRTESSR